ncbi:MULTISPECIES: hypothetical protein [Pseudomonas]|uniref:hypothetical protein n=1 Tax=Pseudomonas TaxID=286 RepID=UPI000733FB00|nr:MULTISPECIES: hypothetical protein [Pseudomonas]MBA1218155.1 hypothetical protein [Pseudomonas fulva]
MARSKSGTTKTPRLAIDADPRWPAFVKRYAFNLYAFAVEVCGMGKGKGVTWQQKQLFDATSRFGCRVSVSSGHGTGKTRSFGVTGLWHLLCYRNSNTYVTAPKLKTVREGVWKEMTNLKAEILKGPHAWVAEYFTIQAEKVYINTRSATWYITTRTAPRGSPENLAGTHGDFLLWMADEASGIPDENFGVIGGALTDKRNRFIMASQPTRNSGYFRDTHYSLSTKQGGEWTSLTFSSETSPLVSDEFLKAKLIQYGGRDESEYQIKVRGMFPTNSSKYLLSQVALERVIEGPRVIQDSEAWGNLIVVDVSAGVGRDKTVATHLRVIGHGDRMMPNRRRIESVDVPIYTNTEDWTPICVRLLEYCAVLSNPTIIIDTSAMGEQFMKRLIELGSGNCHIRGVQWGALPFKNEYRDRFINQRAQATVHAAEAIKDGAVRLGSKYKKDLLDQGSRMPYVLDGLGRYQVASKQLMATEGLSSPDYFDTICMAFLEDADYVPAASEGISVVTDRKKAAIEAGEEAFAGL